MVPVRLEVTVDGDGFEALSANLRDRLTETSIFIETDRPIAVMTPVSIEVSYHTGETALRGDGSVSDIRTEGSPGVLVDVEWEDESKPLVERILGSEQELPLDSWAEALFATDADAVEPNFEPDVDDTPLDLDQSTTSWLVPDTDPNLQLDIPELSDAGVAMLDDDDDDMEEPEELEQEEVEPMADPIPVGPAGLPVFQIPEPAPAPAPAPAPRPPSHRPSLADHLPRASSRPNSVPPVAPRPLPPKGDIIIGIDLGTTYSCAAIVEGGEARVLATRRGKPTLPSVVFYDANGKSVIGEAALKRGEIDASRTIIGSKRLMGRAFHSPIVQEVREHFAYQIVQGNAGEAAIRIDGRTLSLEEVAAEILRELKESVSLQVQGKINRAVITCPAYFNERQREAVRTAGELAGFHVERVLNEPTAAALHYGHGKGFDGRKILVYDLGGGTFDVSLMEVTGQVYEVLATGGDSFLGGIDFDACIAEMLAEAIVESMAIDPRTDPMAVARLLQYAERAKRDLSTRVSVDVKIDHLVVQPYAARSMSIAITQSRAEQAFAPLVARTLSVVEEVCERAGVTLDQVDDILLVGGQTRTPLVRKRVTELFGRPPLSSVHPDYAVALGAAQFAASFETFDSVVLIDALPLSIGVGLPGGRMKKIIERDTRLPCKRRYSLQSTRDNQRSFDILFFQGDDDWVQHNEPLGMLHVPNLPKGARGTISVDVDLEVNEECILKLTARETKTGKVVEAELGTKDTPEEVRRKLGLPANLTHAELARQKEDANRPKGVWRWLTGMFR